MSSAARSLDCWSWPRPTRNSKRPTRIAICKPNSKAREPHHRRPQALYRRRRGLQRFGAEVPNQHRRLDAAQGGTSDVRSCTWCRERARSEVLNLDSSSLMTQSSIAACLPVPKALLIYSDSPIALLLVTARRIRARRAADPSSRQRHRRHARAGRARSTRARAHGLRAQNGPVQLALLTVIEFLDWGRSGKLFHPRSSRPGN